MKFSYTVLHQRAMQPRCWCLFGCVISCPVLPAADSCNSSAPPPCCPCCYSIVQQTLAPFPLRVSHTVCL